MAATDYPSPNDVTITAINVGACAIVLDTNGRVLLHRRADNGLWGLPGGAVEPGESVSAAATRETLEETGFQIAPTGLLGVYSDPHGGMIVRYADGNVRHYVVVAVLANVTAGTAIGANEETLELGWFDPASPPPNLVPAHRQRLRDMAEGRRGILA